MSKHTSLGVFLGVALLVVGLAGCDDDKKAVNPPPGSTVHTVNLAFERHYLDLETGAIDTVLFGQPDSTVDLNIAHNGATTIHSRVFHPPGRQIAHLPNRTFASVTLADTLGLGFTATNLDTAFDANRVIMIKSAVGVVYKLGDHIETANFNDGLRFNYARLSP